MVETGEIPVGDEQLAGTGADDGALVFAMERAGRQRLAALAHELGRFFADPEEPISGGDLVEALDNLVAPALDALRDAGLIAEWRPPRAEPWEELTTRQEAYFAGSGDLMEYLAERLGDDLIRGHYGDWERELGFRA